MANLSSLIAPSGVLTPDNLADQSETIAGLVPAGTPTATVVYVAKNTAPDGFLKANGAAISRTTYSALFGEIGTTYGSGDGSTTFNLPDLRGEFLRGWDDGRGVDSGRSFGSFQDHALEQHQHGTDARTGFSSTPSGSGGGAGGTSAASVDNVIGANTSFETRPRNVALLACIKY